MFSSLCAEGLALVFSKDLHNPLNIVGGESSGPVHNPEEVEAGRAQQLVMPTIEKSTKSRIHVRVSTQFEKAASFAELSVRVAGASIGAPTLASIDLRRSRRQ